MFKITTKLHSFQQQTVEWMLDHENAYDGGMLLSEAGSGKSIISLSLIQKSLKNTKTLIVCPSGLILNWENEIKKHTNLPSTKVIIYHGKSRQTLTKQYTNANIIITSYSIISKEFTKEQKFTSESIFNEHFDRVILDEAHYIRNSNSSISRSTFAIQSTKKWIVTATPVFNETDDMFSYFKFLELEGIESKREWRQLVKSEKGIVKLHALNQMVKKHSYRITKTEVLKSLPPKTNNIVNLQMTDFEHEFYTALFEYSSNRLRSMVINMRKIKHLKAYDVTSLKHVMCNNIMVFILRLKQCCTSPWLVIQKMDRLSQVTNIHEATQTLKFFSESKNRTEECPICYDKTADQIASPCGHKYCQECIVKLNNAKIVHCPQCRSYIEEYTNTSSHTEPLVKTKVTTDDLMMSSKIQFMLTTIKDKIQKQEKVIVVSQWVNMLEIAQHFFMQSFTDVKFISLTGSKSLQKRHDLVDQFQTDINTKVCFLSLMSSAEGINLTAANNVIVLENWWNHSKIAQCVDRTHRIGQTKNVNIYKLVIKDSIEEKIETLVRKKEKISSLVTDTWTINMSNNNYDDNWLVNVIKLIEIK